MSALNAVLAAIHARLSGDAALTALIGPDGVRDRARPRPSYPCILFGETETRDQSTATENAQEHRLTLEVFSDAQGRRQAEEIAARVKALLDDADLAPAGHRLVSLMFVRATTRRQDRTQLFGVELQFRAVTE